MVRLNNRQSGVASLFVVIFAAMVMVIITIGFVRTMLNDQQQATVNDLSQSAYDSAQAGIEDAKRAILRYQSVCISGNASQCTTAYSDISSTTCNFANRKLTDVDLSSDAVTAEVRVQQAGTVNNLDQAYTCVKIIPNTADYIGDLKQDDSKNIPLIGVSDFNYINIEWYNEMDLQGSALSVSVPPSASGTPLLAQSSWVSNRPPILRTQLTQFNSSGFSLTDFDSNANNSIASSSTMFLYPSSINGVPTSGFLSTTRQQATVSPIKSMCSASLSGGGYACSARIQLPITVSAGAKTAYLNLRALYGKAHYRITLFLNSSSSAINFKAVQPEVDSTGRANNLYRRIDARIELGNINFPYPNAAVDVLGNYCKSFVITDQENDYASSCAPQP